MAKRKDRETRRDGAPGRLSEVGWRLRERLLWPVTDRIRDAFDAAIWPFEKVAWTIRKRLLWPLQDAFTRPAGGKARVPRAATFGVIGALALGSLGAGAIVASGSGEDATAEQAPAVVAQTTEPEPEEMTPILAKTEPAPDGPTLKGVRPSFGAKSAEERKAARKALRKLKAEQAEKAPDEKTGNGDGGGEAAAEQQGAGSEEGDAPVQEPERPADATAGDEGGDGGAEDGESAEQPTGATGATASNAAAENKRRKESPLSVAERFAVTFVSYEIGASGRPINVAFRDTADKDLFDALRQRPPRQPAGSKVPKARVMNVVGGPRKKRAMEVSIGLLRVDGVSELRLEMEKIDRGWVVKTVRG